MNRKSILELNMKLDDQTPKIKFSNKRLGLVSLFNDISTFVGYSKPNLSLLRETKGLYIYIYIYIYI